MALCSNKQTCIENQDPVIKALGLQGLAHLCEADVIGNVGFWFYIVFSGIILYQGVGS